MLNSKCIVKFSIFQPKEMDVQDLQDLQNRGWAKVGGSMLKRMNKLGTQKYAQKDCENYDSKLECIMHSVCFTQNILPHTVSYFII